jgi:uncharacterized membrane protein YphA (DoxX/SURF4 family)
MSEYSKIILRIGLSLVFLWFGFNQLIDGESWTVFVPEMALNFGLSASNLVFLNGMAEVIFGLLLILGLFTRVSSFILALHLFGISFGLGYNAIMIRDLGLAIATFVVFLNGRDKWCLDNKIFRGK